MYGHVFESWDELDINIFRKLRFNDFLCELSQEQTRVIVT